MLFNRKKIKKLENELLSSKLRETIALKTIDNLKEVIKDLVSLNKSSKEIEKPKKSIKKTSSSKEKKA